MAKQMRLKYDGVCVECGLRLYRGEYAAYLGRGRGVHCLTSNCSDKIAPNERPTGRQRSRVYSFTTSSGTYTRCNCEDYPCCGH